MVNGWRFFSHFLEGRLCRPLRQATPALPGCCLLCEAATSGSALCPSCQDDLPWNPHACPLCALPLSAGQRLCDGCRQAAPPQQRTLAPLSYGFPVDQLISGLKYHGRLAHAPLLGDILLSGVKSLGGPAPDLLLPVPLHPARLAERGCNQALEIARPLARYFRQPLETRLVRRERATAAQMSLDAASRARNPQGAFRLDRDRLARLGKIRRVAIIDDVMTTGATLGAIARQLQEAGIPQVEYWVVARTP